MRPDNAACRSPARPLPTALPNFWRRFGAVFGFGLIGIAALAASLPARLSALALPQPLATLPPSALVALSLVNPLVLLLLASLAGALCAHRAGLHSAAAGTTRWPTAREWLLAIGSGVALGAAITAMDYAWARAMHGEWAQAGGAASATMPQLLLGILYGGLTEEVLMRWGLMALLAWGLQRWLGRSRATVFAALLAALVFAAAHLPALAAAQELTGALVARTLALNALAGLLYGGWFWRRGLETAMAAHGATHLGFWLVASAL